MDQQTPRPYVTVVIAMAMCISTAACKVRTDPTQQGTPTEAVAPRGKMATQASANDEAFKDGLRQGLGAMMGSKPKRTEQADGNSGLAVDRPFPDNGTSQISFEIAADQELSEVTAYNRSQDNMILLWFYNFGKGDREAARLYLRAGQSGRMTLPTYEYRMAAYTAPADLGLDRGFSDEAKLRDFGFADMRSPSRLLQERASFTYNGYGIGTFRPGKAMQ
jgi:hypothetical protein